MTSGAFKTVLLLIPRCTLAASKAGTGIGIAEESNTGLSLASNVMFTFPLAGTVPTLDTVTSSFPLSPGTTLLGISTDIDRAVINPLSGSALMVSVTGADDAVTFPPKFSTAVIV